MKCYYYNIHHYTFNENGDRFYKIKVYFITLDEKSGAEKKTAAQMLAQATTLKEGIPSQGSCPLYLPL